MKSKGGIERLLQVHQPSSIRFIPYQSPEAEWVLGTEYRQGRPAVAYWVGPDGEIQQGLDAILPVLTGISGGRLIMAVLSLPGMSRLAHRLYGLLARNRYRWFGAVSPKSL